MNQDLVQALRASEGTIIQSQLGTWRMEVGPVDMSVQGGSVEVNWILMKLSEYGAHTLGTSFVRSFIKTVLDDDGSIDYRLFYGERSKPVSSTRVEFLFDPNDLQDTVTRYFEVVDDLLQIADSTIQEWSSVWLDPGLVRPTQEPPKVPKVMLDQALKTNDEEAIIKASQDHAVWKADDIIDLFAKAKELRSNRLMNLVRSISARNESVKKAVKRLVV